MLILSDNYYVRTVFIIVIYNLLTLQRDNNAPQNQRQALWQDQGRSSKLYCGPVIDIQSTVSLLWKLDGDITTHTHRETRC